MIDSQRIRELLVQHLESGVDLDVACADCPELLPVIRKRVAQLRLLEHQLDAFFPSSAPAEDIAADRIPHVRLPEIDGYEIESLLGRGGMGVVYRAKQVKLNRLVALKTLLSGPFASPQEITRFIREAQAVAELQHPHIVQVYDVGDCGGRPYFTMEFVEGGSLAQELVGTPQPALRAAELIVALAGAMQAAHKKGIIHRDLKPANILLSSSRVPKIADFGLARHIDGESHLTITGARVGTPSYMAPEQALGTSGSIGPSVDIYALGAILYEMLTGRPPFRAETARETERQVINVEAVPPSRLNANVPRDLETICLKSLHKDPSRRYPSAAELADDLQRFLKGQPVRARPVSGWERAWRWGWRNQGIATALSVLGVLLVLIVVGSLWGLAHFRRLEGEQRSLAVDKGKLADLKEKERARAVLAERRASELHRQSEAQSQELRSNLYLTEMNLAGQAAMVPSGLGRVSELLARWNGPGSDLRGWEWYYLHGLSHRCTRTFVSSGHSVHHLAWSPDGTRLAAVGADQMVCIWGATDERPPLRLKGHTREVFSIAWSPDGKRLASGSWDRTVRVWDAVLGTEQLCIEGHTDEVYSVAWSPDGNTIASGGRDRTIHISNAPDGTLRHILRGHEGTVAGLAWSSDSQRLASASHDSSIRVWNVVAERAIHTLIGHGNWVNHIAWNPGGTRLASAGNDQTLRIWDSGSGQELRVLRGHTQGVSSLAWSPDGTQIASSSDDETVKVWDAATGGEVFGLRGHVAPLTCVAWNPKGNWLASAGYERSIKVWKTSIGREVPALGNSQQPIQVLAWCPGNPRLCASAESNGAIKLWDLPGRTIRSTFQEDPHPISTIAWHPDGTQLATAGGNGQIRVWNVADGKVLTTLQGHVGAVFSVAWHPGGQKLASGGIDRSIRIWDTETKDAVQVIENHSHFVYSVAWSPDGRQLASASGDRTVKIWDAATGKEARCYRGHASQVLSVAWNPEGKCLASAGYDHTVHVWDATTGQRKRVCRGHTAHVAQVVWNPRTARLASAGRDGSVKVWDTEMGHESLSLANHASQVSAVAWSPDGMILASAGEDRQLFLHDATPGYLAARASELLPATRQRLAVDPSSVADWRLCTEIYAKHHKWSQAGDTAREYLVRQSHSKWLLLDGAVAGPYSADLKQSCPPEKIVGFGIPTEDRLNRVHQESVHWRVAANSAQGIVDFGVFTDRSEHISAYALFPIYSLDDRTVAILLGSDDQAQVWLNGQKLYESKRSRRLAPDEDVVTAKLKIGWNALLARVANETGDHVLSFRLSDSVEDLARSNSGTP